MRNWTVLALLATVGCQTTPPEPTPLEHCLDLEYSGPDEELRACVDILLAADDDYSHSVAIFNLRDHPEWLDVERHVPRIHELYQCSEPSGVHLATASLLLRIDRREATYKWERERRAGTFACTKRWVAVGPGGKPMPLPEWLQNPVRLPEDPDPSADMPPLTDEEEEELKAFLESIVGESGEEAQRE